MKLWLKACMAPVSTLCLVLASIALAVWECAPAYSQEYEPEFEIPAANANPTWRAHFDYVFTWVQGNAVPPLVTTSPAGTLRGDAGELGRPDTTTLFGNSRLDEQSRPGGRFTLASWLDPDATTGVVASMLYVGDNSAQYSVASTGNPILARPFFNVTTNEQNAELVAFPGVVDGQLAISTSSDAISSDLCLRRLVQATSQYQVELLYGYRFLRFHDALTIREDLQSTDPAGLFPIGTTFQVVDQFRTMNQFHGAEIGIVAEWFESIWSVDAFGKLSMGGVAKRTVIDGNSTVTVPGLAPAASAGGLLALPTNMGTRSETDVAFLSEFGLNGSLRVTQSMSFRCGYSVLVLSNVARSGKLIDGRVNPSQLGGGVLAGTSSPSTTRSDSGLWIQGLNLGITFDW